MGLMETTNSSMSSTSDLGQKIRVGFMGLAISHPYVYTNLLSDFGAVAVAVWDYYPDRAAEFAQKHNVQVIDDWQEFAKLDIDLTIMNAVTCDHARFARPLIEARIPLLIDRPMVLDHRDAAQLFALAKSKKSVLVSCSSFRFSPPIRWIAAETRSGRIGRPAVARALVIHPLTWYVNEPRNYWHLVVDQGGGPLVDLAVHGVEMVYMALGPGAEAVSCEASRVRYTDIESEDCASITIRFANGSLGIVEMVCVSEESEWELTVWGSEGKRSFGHGLPRLDVDNLQLNAFWGIYTGMMASVLQAVRTGQFPVPPGETVEIAKILCAARRSAETHRTVWLADL